MPASGTLCDLALVTGAGTGIGRAAALELARRGADIALVGRRREPLEETAVDIRALGRSAHVLPADAADARALEHLFATVATIGTPLRYLVASAGLSRRKPIAEIDEPLFDELIAINLRGPWLALKYGLPLLEQTGNAAVVFVGSMAADIAIAGTSVYAASKAGLRTLARTAAIEYARRGVRINVVHPAFIATPMLERTLGSVEAIHAMGERHPLGRVGQPEDVARPIAFLCSDDAAFITGECLMVDGGYTAQ